MMVYLNEIFDSALNTLIIPLEVKVADQIRTVPFNISAVLTTSDLQFDVENIDFGCCTTSESVFAKIQLKNNSLLAQPFGFINLPDVSFYTDYSICYLSNLYKQHRTIAIDRSNSFDLISYLRATLIVYSNIFSVVHSNPTK